jgi:hypothetical protein
MQPRPRRRHRRPVVRVRPRRLGLQTGPITEKSILPDALPSSAPRCASRRPVSSRCARWSPVTPATRCCCNDRPRRPRTPARRSSTARSPRTCGRSTSSWRTPAAHGSPAGLRHSPTSVEPRSLQGRATSPCRPHLAASRVTCARHPPPVRWGSRKTGALGWHDGLTIQGSRHAATALLPVHPSMIGSKHLARPIRRPQVCTPPRSRADADPLTGELQARVSAPGHQPGGHPHVTPAVRPPDGGPRCVRVARVGKPAGGRASRRRAGGASPLPDRGRARPG